MERDHFSATVEAICAQDPRFDGGAYLFVREALMFTARQQKKKLAAGATPMECHVTGQQLLDGVRRYALDQYGPMVPTVFSHWRIASCEDIGAIVFKLIEAGEFGKTEQDTIADFRGGFDFEEAFVLPFRPAKKQPAPPALPEPPPRSRRPRAAAPKTT
jgi:uncharacterized repeat protein (TIGR04138 family)